MSEPKIPLAFDANGNPLEVPAGAVAWRVRRGGGRRGRPRTVFDGETGRQLEVALSSTIEDLIDHGCPPGRYRLEVVDASGCVLPGVVAVTEIPADAASAGDDEEARPDDLGRAMQLIAQLVDTNCRAMTAMAAAFGPVRPAGPVVVESGPREEAMRPEQLMQTVTALVKTAADAWQAGKAAGGGS